MVDLPITKWIKKKIRRLVGIVEDTDVATHSIASGKYVVWKGDLYKSTEAIAVGGALSLSNLSPVSDGGLNELSEQIGAVNSKLIPHAITITTNSAVTTKQSYTRASVYDRLVFVGLSVIVTTSATGWNQIGSMENGYAPSSDVYFTLLNTDDSSAIYGYISSYGIIYLNGKFTNKLIRGSVTYIKGY